MLELVDTDMKTAIITICHLFKKVEEIMNMLRHGRPKVNFGKINCL